MHVCGPSGNHIKRYLPPLDNIYTLDMPILRRGPLHCNGMLLVQQTNWCKLSISPTSTGEVSLGLTIEETVTLFGSSITTVRQAFKEREQPTSRSPLWNIQYRPKTRRQRTDLKSHIFFERQVMSTVKATAKIATPCATLRSASSCWGNQLLFISCRN